VYGTVVNVCPIAHVCRVEYELSTEKSTDSCFISAFAWLSTLQGCVHEVSVSNLVRISRYPYSVFRGFLQCLDDFRNILILSARPLPPVHS